MLRSALLALLFVTGSIVCAQPASPPDPAPHLDGRIGEAEWHGATQRALTGEGTLLARKANGDLYLAIRGKTDGWSHVYVSHGDTLRVFHASAALGTAVYVQRTPGSWERIATFEWAVRDTSFTPEAKAERAAFFAGHGWTASTQAMGPEGDMEFRIAEALLPPSSRLAVLFAGDPSRPSYWPADLADGTVDADLVRGDPPRLLYFEPTRWADLNTLAHAPEPWVPEVGERHFVAVLAEDIDRSADWYAQAFGLTEHDRWTADDSTARIINLTNERLFVELIWRAESPDVERDLGFYKFGFWVPDVDAVADRVEAATGDRPRALDFPSHGLRLIQLRDPDGNILQLSEVL